MTEAAARSVLHRKLAASRRQGAAGAALLPARVLGKSFARAAESSMSLAVEPASSAERIAPLSDLLELLPERGLLAVLDGPGDAQGLAAFDSDLLSAVIEKQMTGMLSETPRPPRRVTRTDAILAADLIDGVLREFEVKLVGREESRWAAGFAYASHIEDPRPLGLLLEDVDYRIFTIDAGLDAGPRKGRLVLALPAEGRGPVLREPEKQAPDPEVAKRKEQWRDSLHASVRDGEVRLDAVIHKMRIPISAVAGLQPGDEIPVPAMTIDRVRLTAATGQGFGQWRLGQSQGYKALRLGEPIDSRQAETPNPPKDPGATVPEPSEDAVTLREMSGEVEAEIVDPAMEIEGHVESSDISDEDLLGDIPDWPDDLMMPEDLASIDPLAKEDPDTAA